MINERPTHKFGINKIAPTLLKYNYKVKIGDILAGTVVGVEKKHTLVNLGLKQVAFLPNEEIVLNDIKGYEQTLTINEAGEFIVLSYSETLDKTILSFRRLHYLRLWERFKQVDFKNMTLLTKIEKPILGGRLGIFDNLKVFIPSSHLPKYYRRKPIADKFLTIKILEVKDKRHSIVGSSRLALLKKQSPSINIGLTQKVCILSVKPFGIFLNVYGIKCLLHISEILDRKIKDINELYKKGDKITVEVIYINSSQGKIAVSAKNFLT